MSSVDEPVKSSDKVKTEITLDVSPTSYVEVEVLAESGIFKNGQQHDKGAKVVLESRAAERFVGLGEVEVVGAVEAPKESKDE